MATMIPKLKADQRIVQRECTSLACQLHWAALLSKRPSGDNSNSIAVWLLEVMADSNLETPLKTNHELSSQATSPQNSNDLQLEQFQRINESNLSSPSTD